MQLINPQLKKKVNKRTREVTAIHILWDGVEGQETKPNSV